MTACAVQACVALASVIATRILQLGPWYLIKAGLVFLGAMLIAAGRVEAFHPFVRFGAANQVTAGRLAIVALIAASAGEPHGVALAVTIVTAASLVIALDGVDGWLARRSGLRSAFGARFDMETDALLIIALAVLAWSWEKAGAWVLLCGLMRYAFVAAGVVFPWLERPLPESVRRKAICVIQIAGLAAIAVPVVHPPISTAIAAVTLILLTYSFAVDVMGLWRAKREAFGKP